MQFYLLLFVITLLIQFIPAKTNKKYLFRSIATFVPLFLYGALRYDCNDMNEYESFYSFAHGSAWFNEINEHFEYGWALFNFWAPSFNFVLVAQTLIVFASYAFIFYKVIPPKYSWLAVVILFLGGDKSIYFITAMRNSVAIAMLIASIPLIRERKLWQFAIVAVVAGFFHTTAWVMFPLAYIVGRNSVMTKKEVIAWLAVLAFLLVTPIDTIVGNILPFIETETFEKYSNYFEDSHTAGMLVKSVSVVMTCLMLSFVYKESGEDKQVNTLSRLSLLFIYFGFMGTLNARGSQYYIMPLLLATVLLFDKSKNQIVRYGFTALVLAYLAYGLFQVEMTSIYSAFFTFKSSLDFTL